MTMYYSARHRAAKQPHGTRKVGLGVAAVASLGISAPLMVTTSASAAPATVSAPSAKSNFTGTVGYGDRGSLVRTIQRKVGTSADGVFGPATRAAVKRYQSRKGLVADGVVGPRTAAAMGLSGAAARSTSSTRPSSNKTRPSTTFSGTVRQGARGAIVRQIQRKVGVSADGVFGPATRWAVSRYQSRHGLTADGIVGPRTGSTMGLSGSHSSGSSSSSAPKRSSRTSTRSVTNGSVLSTAARYVGSSYRMGGTSPSGWDCSGYTQYVFARHGKNLPRTAEQQRRSSTRVSSPQPGDLVFFGAPAWHVGIYAGNGKMYDAGNPRVNTVKRSIWTSAVTYGRV